MARHRDGVTKIIRRPARWRGGLRKLEEVRSIDQAFVFFGLFCRQVVCIYGHRLAPGGQVDEATIHFESNAHGSQEITTQHLSMSADQRGFRKGWTLPKPAIRSV